MSEQLKVLLRKEFRRQSSLVVAAFVFVALPYVLVLIFQPSHTLEGGAVIALFISCLLAGFFAGNGVATERPSRSIEFLGYLPIPRHYDFWSRITAASLLSAAFIIGNLLVLANFTSDDFLEGLLVYVPTTLGLFGISWLASTIFRSPVISATAGLAVIVALVILGANLQSSYPGARANYYWQWEYPILAASLGITSLIAGSVYHLKRRILA